MGNQTHVVDNKNKFFLLQCLESNSKPGKGITWARWGRVGYDGQHTFLPTKAKVPGPDVDIAKAVTAFADKYRAKTGNDWSDRKSFVEVPGKYTPVVLEYAAPAAAEKVPLVKAAEKKAPKSKLPAAVAELMRLVFNITSFTGHIVSMRYDAEKMPLGRLAREQIRKGFQVLKDIESALSRSEPRSTFVELTNSFYTLIPHAFGVTQAPRDPPSAAVAHSPRRCRCASPPCSTLPSCWPRRRTCCRSWAT